MRVQIFSRFFFFLSFAAVGLCVCFNIVLFPPMPSRVMRERCSYIPDRNETGKELGNAAVRFARFI